MKKEFKDILFTLTLAFALSLVFSSCSDSDIAGISGGEEGNGEFVVTGTMANVAVFEETIGDEDYLSSKAQVYYDRVGKQLMFSWYKPNTKDEEEYNANVDCIGIYPEVNLEENPSPTLMKFKLDPAQALIVKQTTTTGSFISADNQVANFTNGQRYYSFFPYRAQTLETGAFNYTNVPVSFAGQVQTANEQMGYYFENTTASKALFLESEKAAAAHLGKYDYMASSATSPSDQYVKFYYEHVGSIARFYMVCPSRADDNIFYDSLQVYNSEANFTINATLNITTKELTPTRTSHVMSLGFHPAIDMTCSDEHNSEDAYQKKISYYWQNKTNGAGCIMAYMMFAPIKLKELTEAPTLYLLGRQASYYDTKEAYNEAKGFNESDPGFIKTNEAYAALPKIQRMKIYEASELAAYNTAKGTTYTAEQFAALPLSDRMKGYTRKYYKATLSKLDCNAGKHHQWSVANAPEDAPITFEEISIQEWEEGPGFTNGEGDGTGEW